MSCSVSLTFWLSRIMPGTGLANLVAYGQKCQSLCLHLSLAGSVALQHVCCWTLPQCDLPLSSPGQLVSTGEAPVAIHAAADFLPIIHDHFLLDSYSSSAGLFLAVLMHSWP